MIIITHFFHNSNTLILHHLDLHYTHSSVYLTNLIFNQILAHFHNNFTIHPNQQNFVYHLTVYLYLGPHHSKLCL